VIGAAIVAFGIPTSAPMAAAAINSDENLFIAPPDEWSCLPEFIEQLTRIHKQILDGKIVKLGKFVVKTASSRTASDFRESRYDRRLKSSFVGGDREFESGFLQR
jgi:hypothetical protein